MAGVSLSQTAPSGIPGDLPEVIQPYQVWGSAWWTLQYPFARENTIECTNKNLEHKESSLIGDSDKGS